VNTVGPATKNACQANSVRTRGTNSRGAPAERIGLAGAATVNMSWRYGGVDVVSTLWVSTQHCGLVRDAVFHCMPTLADDAGEVVLSPDRKRHSRFRRRRARYSWRLEYHAAVASGVYRRRDDLSNRLTSRLDCRHSPSNQGSDGRRRMVTVFAGICLSRTDMILLSSVQQAAYH